MLSCVVSIALAITLASGSAPATGDEAAAPHAPAPSTALGPDEVQLLNGGFVRGTLVEVAPEQRVVILPDGAAEPRAIPWEEIARVERGKHDPNGPRDPQPPRRVVRMAPAQSGPGRPHVHIELVGNRPIKLFEIDNEILASGYNSTSYGIQFRSICVAPCNRVIDGSRGQSFFLATARSPTWTASRKFSLDDRVGSVRLIVRPGNAGLRIAGAVLLGIGLGALISGAVVVASESTRPIGIGLLAGGAPLFAAGIPMLVLGRTRYEMSP